MSASFRPPPAGTPVLEHLARLARDRPDELAYQFPESGETMTCAELRNLAASVAAALGDRVQRGDRVAVALPTSPVGIAALLGVWMRGATLVVLPGPIGRGDGVWRDHAGRILKDCGARALLTTTAVIEPEDRGFLEGLVPVLDLDGSTALSTTRPTARYVLPDADDLAILQYTSGSTAFPRGVRISHANLTANLDCISQDLYQDHAERAGSTNLVGWLPLFHDMGLISTLSSMWNEACAALISPQSFVMNPLRWLELISTHRAVGTAGPNFAYQLCVDRARRRPVTGLDLSSWRFAVVGAEMTRRSTIDAFCETFGPWGFRREAFVPCYGLAEATLLVSGRHPAEGPRSRQLARDSLTIGQRARVVSGDEPGIDVVSSGAPAHGMTMTIKDAAGDEVGNGVVGEIVVSGRAVSQGYWTASPSATERFSVTEYGNAFATADYGTMIDGELYVLGRMDDTIIIDGRNIYPDDVESLVSASAAGPRVSLVAAVPHPEGGAIVIVAECRGSAVDDVVAAAEITEGIRRTVSGATGVRVAEVALVQRGQIPTTTSGKIRRKECARYWAEGRLESWA